MDNPRHPICLTSETVWLPLGTTPNRPEYPAAHACITSAVSHLIAGYFGIPKVHIVVDSLALRTALTPTALMIRARLLR
jgi:hypothetical protein